MRHLPAILLIWVGCALAWMVLGSSLVFRTGSSGGALGEEVRQLWGPPLEQRPPTARRPQSRAAVETIHTTDARGRDVVTEERRVADDGPGLPLVGSAIDVRLALTQRQKGLLWFPTYAVDFDGRYRFRAPPGEARDVEVRFPLGAGRTIYDGLEVTDETGQALPARIDAEGARFMARFEPGAERTFRIRYRSRGTSTWGYRLTEGTGEVRDFALALTTDFDRVDFSPGSLAPSTQRRSSGAWHGEWRFKRLVADSEVKLLLPERINPGPLASRITFFAPVGLLFFFFVVAILTTADGRRIHPMNYFFFGMAFFAFHLLFAYLVDHVAVVPSFALAALVSIALVTSYARLFTGWDYALRRIAVAQALYLVLFSATFFWQGFTGLAITVGAILTLFVMMQATGRTDWDAASRVPAAPLPATPTV